MPSLKSRVKVGIPASSGKMDKVEWYARCYGGGGGWKAPLTATLDSQLHGYPTILSCSYTNLFVFVFVSTFAFEFVFVYVFVSVFLLYLYKHKKHG